MSESSSRRREKMRSLVRAHSRYLWRTVLAVMTVLMWSVPLGMVGADTPPAPPPPSANVSVFATGLQAPRGLRFGPDGSLYVAEGGAGGTNSTAGQCTQVVPPV